jgi:hypothetical protein
VISRKNLDIHVAVLALTQRAGCYLTTGASLKEETSWMQGLLLAGRTRGDEGAFLQCCVLLVFNERIERDYM